MTRTDQWIKSYLSEEEPLNEGLIDRAKLKMLEPLIKKELEKLKGERDLLDALEEIGNDKKIKDRKKWDNNIYPKTVELINSGKIKNGWELMKHLVKY